MSDEKADPVDEILAQLGYGERLVYLRSDYVRLALAELEAARKRVVELETEKAGASARADEWEHRFDKLSALAKAERADLEQSLRLERERHVCGRAADCERCAEDVKRMQNELTAHVARLRDIVKDVLPYFSVNSHKWAMDMTDRIDAALAATPSESLAQLRASIIAECAEFAQTWIDLHDPAQWCDMPREMRAALSDPPHESKEGG